LLACLLIVAGGTASAAEAIATSSADLGAGGIATSKEASAARAATLHRSMACGNELDFARRFSLESRSYKENNPSDPNLDNWPVTLLLGKAARLIDQSRDGRACESVLEGDVQGDWLPLTASRQLQANETAADVVNRVYRDLYDGEYGSACTSVAHMEAGQPVHVILPDACLARQIRAVMTDPGHGPWEWKDGEIIPKFPGTSAGKLPCLSEFKTKLKGLDGDWDQGVIQYTRLAALLYRYGQSSQPIGMDLQMAIDALNTRFLTLRSSPEQGATARETFNLISSCGNLPNQFGSAMDTVNGTGSDPGYDRYSNEAKDAVGDDDSFWKKLLHFLKALAVAVAIAVGAALIGTVAGIIAGAITGAVAVAAAVAVAVGLVVLITFAFGGIEETENHLLMQNTSRYIKNKLMMSELSNQGNRQAFDIIAKLNEEVRIWLLEHLQRIAKEDFVEYNAKPYNRLSHASILNLLDYACDVSWDYDRSRFIFNTDDACDDKDFAVVRAAASVMDLSAAKLAVGSFEGRRLVPYRRLAEHNFEYYNGRSILELASGADNQLAALQIWTGQMRHAPDGKAAPVTFEDLAWFSTSQYHPDALILNMAVDKSIPREQQYRHHTRERYTSGNGWLITAGGTDEGPAQGFRSPLGFTIYPPINNDVVNDRGVGVPTTLMTGARTMGRDGKPTDGRARVREFLRFEGNKKDWGKGGPDGNTPLWSFSDNNCVAGSFACGLALRLPADFDVATCQTRLIAVDFFVVDSTLCAAFNDGDGLPANDIFIAIYKGSGVLGSPTDWGFFEVAQQDAYHRSVAAFADAIIAQNQGRFSAWTSAKSGDKIEYFAVTQNRLLKFTPKDEDFGADRRACGVVNHESGARLTISSVPAGQSGACLSVGPRIFIDLNDEKNPIRRGEGGLALEPFGR
jgi:hypothetical protein